MKKGTLFIMAIFLLLLVLQSFGQASDNFKLLGNEPGKIVLDQLITESTELFPFEKNVNKVFGLAISADVSLIDETSSVQVILVSKNFEEYLVYETNHLLAEKTGEFSIEEICDETCILNNVQVSSLRIEITNASIHFKSITYCKSLKETADFHKLKKEKNKQQNFEKINQINKKIKEKGLGWVAGPTKVSELSYSEKRKLFGQSTFPAGFEYYTGGVISTSTENSQLKSASTSPYVDEWDWRNRHGKNWITPVTNQEGCGSCWAFAAAGTVEAMVNLYYNQQLHLDLSEQDLLSCSGAGDCLGGSPMLALQYVEKEGIVDEQSFPYSYNTLPCENKLTNYGEKIKINGIINFGIPPYDKSEDNLKMMLINFGVVSSALYDWSHAMTLVGYKVVKAGDIYYYRGLDLNTQWQTIEDGNPLIGKTIWIFKNSWGPDFGDNGYVYVETPISNVGISHAIKLPLVSEKNNFQVVCEDADGDGYYWWGLGPKPATCEGPDTPDGNDADPTLGPIDEYGNYTVLSGAPVVSISASQTEINAGVAISFSDNSTNNPIAWEWTFGGGMPATSSLKNPEIIFEKPGEYDITLTVRNEFGSNSKTFTKYIRVLEPVIQPIAHFSADMTNIYTGGVVSFSDLSDNKPTSWNWTFEGGNPASSTLQNPKVTYETAGTYGVSLVTGNSAGTSTKEVNDFIVVEEIAPQYCSSNGDASKLWIASVEVGANNNTSSTNDFMGYQDYTDIEFQLEAGKTTEVILKPDFSGPAKKVCWAIWIDYNGDSDFDDVGELVFSSSASSKTMDGSFFVPEGLRLSTRMRVSMKQSVVANQCEIFSMGEVEDYSVFIHEPAPEAPVVEFSSDKSSISPGESISFIDLTQNEPTQWEWNFPGGTPAISNEKNPVVTYSSTGQFDVTLTVSKPGFSPVKKTKEKYVVIVENSHSEYCTPVGINSSGDFISEVKIGDFINSSGGEGYSINSTPVNFNSGVNYDLMLTPANGTNRNFWGVWLDTNGDGDFEDAGEKLVSINNKKGAVSSVLTIPYTEVGTTRMRIVMQNLQEPIPCSGSFDGETEDYLVSLNAAAANFGATIASAIEQNSPDNFRLFPNPTKQILNIELNTVSPDAHYRIFDLSGKEMAHGKLSETITGIGVSGYAQGMYMIMIVNGRQLKYEKFIKE